VTDEDELDIAVFGDEFVKASELREFVYCERSWFLNRHGFRVSEQAEKAREVGTVFHEQRAAAAERGTSGKALTWVVVLVVLAIALLLAKALIH
jgi:hypothetical protein